MFSQSMIYLVLADALVLVHALFIVFVVLGGLLTIRWRWVVYLHVPALVWAVLLELFAWRCPLTPWEQQLRRAAGAASYEGGFISHYLLPLIYPAGLTPDIQVLLGGFVVVINTLIYAAIAWFRRRS